MLLLWFLQPVLSRRAFSFIVRVVSIVEMAGQYCTTFVLQNRH